MIRVIRTNTTWDVGNHWKTRPFPHWLYCLDEMSKWTIVPGLHNVTGVGACRGKALISPTTRFYIFFFFFHYHSLHSILTWQRLTSSRTRFKPNFHLNKNTISRRQQRLCTKIQMCFDWISWNLAEKSFTAKDPQPTLSSSRQHWFSTRTMISSSISCLSRHTTLTASSHTRICGTRYSSWRRRMKTVRMHQTQKTYANTNSIQLAL